MVSVMLMLEGRLTIVGGALYSEVSTGLGILVLHQMESLRRRWIPIIVAAYCTQRYPWGDGV